MVSGTTKICNSLSSYSRLCCFMGSYRTIKLKTKISRTRSMMTVGPTIHRDHIRLLGMGKVGGSGTYEQHLPSALTRKDLRDCQSPPEQQTLRWWGHHWCKATCVLSYLLFPQLCGKKSQCPEIQLLRTIQQQNNLPDQIFFTFPFLFFLQLRFKN